MKTSVLLFLALLTTIWLAINVITGMVQFVKSNRDNTQWYVRVIMIIAVSVLWAAFYAAHLA